MTARHLYACMTTLRRNGVEFYLSPPSWTFRGIMDFASFELLHRYDRVVYELLLVEAETLRRVWCTECFVSVPLLPNEEVNMRQTCVPCATGQLTWRRLDLMQRAACGTSALQGTLN